MNDLVSIVTPVYNSQEFLSQSIKSVLKQTYIYWEHILVDDCSNDNSAAIIESYGNDDNRIKYHRLTKNSGAGVARNKAISMARGRYIAFLDSDDLWHPQKLERQLDFMNKNNYYFTFTSYNHIDEKGKTLSTKSKAKSTVTYKDSLFKNPIGCLTVLYDVHYFGKEYMPTIRKRQDYALWLRLLKSSNGYGLDECLASYRKRSKSISSNKLLLLKYEWKIYREIEGLSWIKSLFYLLSAIIVKLKSYF